MIDKKIGTSANGPVPYWTPISRLSLKCPLKADVKKEDIRKTVRKVKKVAFIVVPVLSDERMGLRALFQMKKWSSFLFLFHGLDGLSRELLEGRVERGRGRSGKKGVN
jgi:hypothetical protein